MTVDRENRLSLSLKEKNARLNFEVAKLRVDLALFKEEASLCEGLNCEIRVLQGGTIPYVST